MHYIKIGLFVKDNWRPIFLAIFAFIVILLFGPFLLFSSSTPGASEEQIKKYMTVATSLQINWVELVAFDMVKYQNDLEDKDPNDSAYHFIKLKYEEFTTKETCTKTNEQTGECEETKTEEVITSTKEVQGKKNIKDFFKSFDFKGDDIANHIASINGMEGKRVTISALTLDDAMKDAGFTEKQKEMVHELIKTGMIQDLYPNSVPGVGAVCTAADGSVDPNVLQAKVDQAGAFRGHLGSFVSAAQQHQIDPVLLMAIAFHETGYGKSKAVVNKNNPGGLMNPATGWKTLQVFPTLQDGINAMARNLYKNYIGQGLVTIPQIGMKYAPIGAGNDPTNLNIHWVPTVTKIVNELGGLSMNCEVIGADGGNGEFAVPTVTYKVTSKFGNRPNPTGGGSQFHKGLDLACKKGEPIKAAKEGTVAVGVPSGWGGGFGHHVILGHGDKYTLYAHMTTVMVTQGATITKGQQIGTCGSTGDSTGPHLHFEVRVGGPKGDKIDPEPFFSQEELFNE